MTAVEAAGVPSDEAMMSVAMVVGIYNLRAGNNV